MSEPTGSPPTGGAVLEVDLDGEHHRLPWPEGKVLLEVMEEAGLDAPFSCREGHCGACACELVDGEVALRANDTLSAEDLADGCVLACQAEPRTPLVRITYD